MNLEKALHSSYSKNQVQRIAQFISNDAQLFKRLVGYVLRPDPKKIQLAAGSMSICVEKNPLLLKGYIQKLIKAASSHASTDSLKRNVLRALQFVKIPEKDQGVVADYCFNVLTSRDETIASKVFAMTILGNLAMEHPDLKQELRQLLEAELALGSPGYVSRAKKVLKQLHQDK